MNAALLEATSLDELKQWAADVSFAHDNAKEAAEALATKAIGTPHVDYLIYLGCLRLVNEMRGVFRASDDIASTANTATTKPRVGVEAKLKSSANYSMSVLDSYMINNQRAGDCDYDHLDQAGSAMQEQGSGLIARGRFVHRLRDCLKRKRKGTTLREVIDEKRFNKLRSE